MKETCNLENSGEGTRIVKVGRQKGQNQILILLCLPEILGVIYNAGLPDILLFFFNFNFKMRPCQQREKK